jgi:hypothetical protein
MAGKRTGSVRRVPLMERVRSMAAEAREEIERLEAQRTAIDTQIAELRRFCGDDVEPAVARPGQRRTRRSREDLAATARAIVQFISGEPKTTGQIRAQFPGASITPSVSEFVKKHAGVKLVRHGPRRASQYSVK